jgi:hypothetical protein
MIISRNSRTRSAIRIFCFNPCSQKSPHGRHVHFLHKFRLSVKWLLWKVWHVTQFILTYLKQSLRNYRLTERQDDQWIMNWQGFRNRVFWCNLRHCSEICLKKLVELKKTRKYSGFPEKDLNTGRPQRKTQMQVFHLRHSLRQIQEYWARWRFMATQKGMIQIFRFLRRKGPQYITSPHEVHKSGYFKSNS